MKRPKTNSKLIVAFVVILLTAYVILALTCNGQELDQIQIMSCGPFAVISHYKYY